MQEMRERKKGERESRETEEPGDMSYLDGFHDRQLEPGLQLRLCW